MAHQPPEVEEPVEGPSTERPLTPKTVAHMFSVSVVTVAKWADEGKLASFRTPGGQRRFWRADVEAFLRQRTAPEVAAS